MLLCIDIGNSNISIGVMDISSACVSDIDLVSSYNISSRDLSSDEYAQLITTFLSIDNIYPSERSKFFPHDCAVKSCRTVDCCVICSIVPSMTAVFSVAAEAITCSSPLVIGAGMRTGLGIHIKDPAQLGADIVADSVYAIELADPPIAILDVGTATTLTIIDQNMNIIGTIIMPGLMISLEALTESAAQLYDVALSETCNVPLIGRDSVESIRSGVLNGQALAIDGFLRNIREQLFKDEKLSLIATGNAHLIIDKMRNKFSYFPGLTLLGAAKLYLLNHGKH